MSGKARKYQQEGAEESSDDDEEAPEDEEAEEDEEGEEDEEESSKGLLAPVARRPRHTPERVKLCLVTVFCALPVLTSGYAAHLLSRLESEEQTFESFRHRERLALKATRLAELFSADRVQHAAALAEVAPDGRSAWNTSVLSLLDDIAGSVDASYNATPDAAVASDVKRSIDAVDQSVREWLRATVIDVELLQQLAAFNGSLRAAPAAGVHRQAFGEVFKALDGISLDLIPADAYPPSVDVLALRADLAQMHLAVHQVRAAFFAYIRTGDYQHAESLEGYMRTAIALADQLDSATSAGGGNTSTPELAAGVTVLAQLSGNLSEARGGLAGWWQKTAALSLAARAAAGNASSNTGVDDFPSLVLALRRQNRSQRALSLGGSVASQIRALEDAVQGVPADAEGSFARGVLVCVFVGLAVLLFVHGLASCYADVERRAADPATRACGVAGFAAKKRLHGYFAAGYCLLVVDVVAAYLASESYLGTLDASHAMAVGRSRCGAGLGSALTEVNEILLLRSHLVLLDQGTYADVEQSYQHLLGTLLAVDGEAEAFPFAEWQRFRQTIGMVAAPLAAWYDRFSADYRSLEAARGFAGDGSLVTTPDFEAAVSAAVSAPNGSEWASLPEDLHEAYATYLDHRIYAPLRVRQYTCQEVDPERRQAQV
ncbi:hypothetical protein DIPPA_32552 [Diplonema papillatum]|nr:hypothetical protein DIPPA_32552 [Diplonema papillatum]